jgi:hypothetical protein
MGAVEEMFLLLDQIWRTVKGISVHRGGGRFLEGYCASGRDLASRDRPAAEVRHRRLG